MRMQPEAAIGAVYRHEAILVALAGSIALAAALGIGRFVYTPILPPMVEALGFTKSTAGLIASANFLGYLIGALLVASPILGGSRRMWLLGALAMSAITTGAMGLVNSVAAFVVLRFVGGAASAFVLVLASTLVLERLAEAGHARLSALCFAGVGIGIAISAVLVAAMLRAGQNWQSLWLASGALSLVAAFVVGICCDPIRRWHSATN
jgi:MFS family permease